LFRLSLENDAGDRVMFGMAESNQGRSDAALCTKLLRWSGKDKKRLARWFFADVDIRYSLQQSSRARNRMSNACRNR
jgi:hypothetical protein